MKEHAWKVCILERVSRVRIPPSPQINHWPREAGAGNPLFLDSINNYLGKAYELPKDKNPMWMGRYLCTCEIVGIRHKVYISVYGGFFFDEFTKKYFQISKEAVDDWINFWNVAYESMNK